MAATNGSSSGTAATPSGLYGPLRLLVRNDVAIIQPESAASLSPSPPTVDTLCVDLGSGKVSRVQMQPLMTGGAGGSGAATIPALIGLLRLRGGAALAVVTGAERVASLDGAPVYRVTSTAVITPGMRVVGGGVEAAASNTKTNLLTASISLSSAPRANPAVTYDAGDRRLLRLLRSALDADGAGRGLFFCLGDGSGNGGGGHLTLHTQARADLLARAAQTGAPLPCPARCADRRFFWNRALAAPLLDASSGDGGGGGGGAAAAAASGGDPFVPTFVLGSLRVVEGVELPVVPGSKSSSTSTTVTVDVALFARRAADRAGARHWRRGADATATGAVANFVETEQVVTARWGEKGSDGSTTTPRSLVASYVQVRGSVPLVWTQLPNIKYKPPTVLLDGESTRQAFDAHAKQLYERYVVSAMAGSSLSSSSSAAPSGAITCVNLVNQSGSEGALADQFGREVERHNGEAAAAKGDKASCPPLRYVAFDFHHECGATNYGPGLTALWRLLADDFERDGMWVVVGGGGGAGGAGATATTTTQNQNQRQCGVIRTNCVDCLDRTNVVQGLLGRKALARALAMAGALPAADAADPGSGPALPSALEPRFKHLWADHGDDVSRQYAGTGALKSGFTRTGKRTVWGLLDDGAKSCARYWRNNFSDGWKQDSLDLATGAYTVRADRRVRFRPRAPTPLLPVGAALGALAWGGAALGRAFGEAARLFWSSVAGGGKRGGGGGGGSAAAIAAPSALLTEVALPLALAAAILLLVVRNGRHLVDAPQLCPEEANTVGAAVGGGGGEARKVGGKAKAAAHAKGE
jgi:hypothetical protein